MMSEADLVVILSFGLPGAAATGGTVALVMWFRRWHARKIEHLMNEAYLDGVQDGQKYETDWAVRDAVERERLSVRRRLADSGRRHMARPGAPTAVIRRVEIAPPPPIRPPTPM